MLSDLLTSLIEIGLLKQFDDGVVTGSKSSIVYIKSLPATETLNTTNKFTLDILDKINLPWLIYKQKCTNMLLPSDESVLSDEANEYVQQGIYQR